MFSLERARFFGLEPLEPRLMLASDWTNYSAPLDVNGDMEVSPVDALAGINRLNEVGSGELPALAPGESPDFFFDSNGDRNHSPIDTLAVINALNGLGPFLAVRLANDTAPAGTTNDDGVTSDAEILGGISTLDRVDSFRVSIDSQEPADFVELSPSLVDGAFRLSGEILEEVHGSPLQDGRHTIYLEAIDSIGASSGLQALSFQLDTQAPRLISNPSGSFRHSFSSFEFELDEDLAPFTETDFGLQRDGGSSVVTPSVARQTDKLAAFRVDTGDLLQRGSYQFALNLFDVAGNAVAPGSFQFSVASVPGISSVSPADGEESVNVARKLMARFDEPIDPATVNENTFFAIANGQAVPGQIRVSSNERLATFLPDSPLTPSTEVRFVVNGDGITAKDGTLVDADGDGEPGGRLEADFRTLSITRIPNTNVFGFVRDSYTQQPLAGATIRLDAFPDVFAVTDENGRFELEDVPAPDFFVVIDGSTVVDAPPGKMYPTLGKPFHSVPGETVQLEMAGQPFDIFLPSMSMEDVQDLSPTEDTVVGFGEGAKAELAALFPDVASEMWDQTEVTFPARSAINDAGESATQAVIVPVPPDRLPAPLPPGIDVPMVISVQAGIDGNFNGAGGATSFDVPAPISLPNLDNLPPGDQVSLNSFDHAAGRWESVGTATVSDDGRSIVSDPGSGVIAPGWHYVDRLMTLIGHALAPLNGPIGTKSLQALAAFTKFSTGYLNFNKFAGPFARSFQTAGTNTFGALSDGEFTNAESLATALSWTSTIIGGIALTPAGAAVTIGGTALLPPAALTIGVVSGLVSLSSLIVCLFPTAEAEGESAHLVAGGSFVSDLLPPAREQLELLETRVQTLLDAVGELDRRGSESLGIILDSSLKSLVDIPLERVSLILGADYSFSILDDGVPAIDPDTGQQQAFSLQQVFDAAELSVSEVAAIRSLLNPDDINGLVATVEALTTTSNNPIEASATEALRLLQTAATIGIVSTGGTFVSVGGQRIRANAGGGWAVRLPAFSTFTVNQFNPNSFLSSSQVVATGAPGTIQTEMFGINIIEVPEAIDVLLSSFDGRPGGVDASSAALRQGFPTSTLDNDRDGLGRIAEAAIGTSATNADTDGDGIDDLTEVLLDLDPLGGRGFPTGVIASLPLQGEAKEVVVAGALTGAESQTAFVATGSHGLAVVDTSQFDNPIIQGQLALSGNATDVTVDAELGVAVVAGNAGGLHFVDVSDPMLPNLIRTVPFQTGQVELANGIVYAGESANFGRIATFDLLTGARIEELTFAENSPITGLAREGVHLYSLDAGKQLRSFDISRSRTVQRDPDGLVLPDISNLLPFRPGKLFVNNGIAYAMDTGFGGYATIDVSRSTQLEFIAPISFGFNNLGPNADVFDNGSGTGLLVGQNNTEVIDVSDPNNTFVERFRISMPSNPESVTVAGGIGFVAGGVGGLHVLNYLPFDNQGIPPAATIDVVSSVVDADPDTAGIQILEGSEIPLTITLEDDVQVRNVQLLVNGDVVANDISAPFDFVVPAPALDPDDPALSIQVQAVDTGGNGALSNTLDFDLIADTQPPALLASVPAPNGIGFEVSSISVFFDEALLPELVDMSGVTLVNVDTEELIAIESVSTIGNSRIRVATEPLETGLFQLTLDPRILSDTAGNSPESDIQLRFSNIELIPGAVQWISRDGDWADPFNWSTGTVPAADDNVVVDIPGIQPEVTIFSGSHAVGDLRAEGPLRIDSGSLSVFGTAALNDDLTLAPTTQLVVSGNNGDVTVRGAVSLDGSTVEARGGGKLRFPTIEQLQIQTVPAEPTLIRAQGTGSLIDFGNATSLSNTAFNAELAIEAAGGGSIDLSGVASIETSAGSNRGIEISAQGLNSRIDVASASTFFDRRESGVSILRATGGGRIDAPQLVELEDVSVTIEGAASLPTAQITSVSGGDLDLSGAGLFDFGSLAAASGTTIDVDTSPTHFPQLQNVDSASLIIRGGGVLSLPEVRSYQIDRPFEDATLQAAGAGSRLELSNLGGISYVNTGNARLTIQAAAGGVIDLPTVELITTLEEFNGGSIDLIADGLNSQVRLDSLQSFQDLSSGEFSELRPANRGLIHAPLLTRLTGASVQLDRASGFMTSQLETIARSQIVLSGLEPFDLRRLSNATDTQFEVDGVSVDLSSLSQADSTGFIVQGGVTLAIPELTTLTHGLADNRPIFRARGINSRLELPNLVNIQNATTPRTFRSDTGPITIEAVAGGAVVMDRLAELSVSAGRARGIELRANGPDSEVSLPSLQSFVDQDRFEFSLLKANHGGSVNAPALTDLAGVDLQLDGTGSSQTAQVNSFTDGRIHVSGDTTVDFAGLAVGDGTKFMADGASIGLDNLVRAHAASFLVSGGATLSVPALTTFQQDAEFLFGLDGDAVFRASGSGSRLLFPQLRELVHSGVNYTLQVQAIDGGTIDLDAVQQISVEDRNGANRVELLADGDDSRLQLGSLLTLTDGAAQSSQIAVSNNGVIAFGTTPPSVSNTTVTLNGGNIVGGLTVGAGGELSGRGVIQGRLNNRGLVTLGQLRVNGNYTQEAGATLVVEVNGTDSGMVGELNIQGAAAFDGSLHVLSPAEFAPSLSDPPLTVIHYATSSGAFSTTTIGGFGGAVTYELIRTTNHIELRPQAVAPNPEGEGPPRDGADETYVDDDALADPELVTAIDLLFAEWS